MLCKGDDMDLTEDLEATARDLSRRIKPQAREVARRLDALNNDAIQYVRENPVKCLLGALALGVVIGKIAGRR
jgi:ElaB/YqjD/DUF883 family membrane-anchored ribosome-binding protein